MISSFHFIENSIKNNYNSIKKLSIKFKLSVAQSKSKNIFKIDYRYCFDCLV